MHQLALAFKDMGLIVYGYDLQSNQYTNKCAEAGIQITDKFVREFLNVDLCVRTAAIKDDNKYIKHLKNKKIKIIDRAETLGMLASKFKTVIAVAGTHGKSTTASLIYEMLRVSKKKVSCHIGADVFLPRFSLNDDYLVVEACEYNKSFLKLYPTISVVTNIEKEHMDCYENFFDLKNSFLKFLRRTEKKFVYLDDTTKFLKKYKNISFVDKTDLSICPLIKGEHNLKNISLAIEVAKYLNIEEDIIKSVVNTFTGVPRRYECVGRYNSSKVYIDYAHHPTEIKAFTETFLKENKDAVIVFQPHTYSRTKMFLKDFIKVLSNIKNIIIYKEYPAREKKQCGLSAKDLYNEIKKINPQVKYCASIKNIMKNMDDKTNIAFVGAGDIDKVAKKIVKSI